MMLRKVGKEKEVAKEKVQKYDVKIRLDFVMWTNII